jgi:predicted nucleic acid-binding protein
MPYQISDIRSYKPKPADKFLFDANVWLAILDSNFQSRFSPDYENFFNKIIVNNLNPKATIVMPSLLLSEVLNRYMHDIFYKEFLNRNPLAPGQSAYTKHDYRDNPQYQIDFGMACASLRSYHQQVAFISDNLSQFTFKKILKNIPVNLDFNDHIYCQLAIQQGLIIVTMDRDFAVEDIPILTTHPALLKLK